MTRRIGISEAPLATLGEVDTTQHIPIVQADNDGKNEPRRSTIADMKNYFIPDPIPVQPITQIGIAVTGNQSIVIPGGIASGERFNAGFLNLQASTVRELTSNTGNLIPFGADIFIRDGGTYKISIRIQVEYANTRQIISYRWLGDINAEVFGNTENFSGYFIRPTPSNVRLTYTLGEIEILTNIPSGNGFRISMGLTNCGTTTSPTTGTETMDVTGINSSHPTIITIQRMAE